MFSLATLLALAKILLGFCLILFGVSRKWGLWISILLGALAIGLLFGLSLPDIVFIVSRAALSEKFLLLMAIILGILVLSDAQEYTGQGRRLVTGMEAYMRSPRVRLAFFPALIGLLPMPGGAIFSCPMVRDTAAGTTLNDEQKGLINYWFRHIWEISWPLYPGYILTCNLAGIPMSELWHYTFPVVGISVVVGWLYYLRRDIRVESAMDKDTPPRRPLGAVLLEGLPIFVSLAGAPVVSVLAEMLGFDLPAEGSFIVSLSAAVVTVFWQNKTPVSVLPKLLFKKQVAWMLLIIFAIFAFKDVIVAAKVVESLAGFAESKPALLALFVFLPLLTGVLTGLMAGFVGAAFPLLLSLLSQMQLQDERLSWIMLALVAGNLGQMTSPVHTCFVVTSEFFRVPFATMWRNVATPATIQFGLAVAYVAVLHAFGAKL